MNITKRRKEYSSLTQKQYNILFGLFYEFPEDFRRLSLITSIDFYDVLYGVKTIKPN